MSGSIVRFDGVSKRYGLYPALSDINLDIMAGQFVTLLGPSGCGKSTTLRLLAGFERPSAGRIFLAGRDVTDVPPHQRNVNLVFQDYALFPHLNVERNIAFGLEVKGRPKPAIAARVAHLLDLIRMRDYAARMPDQLSGGQRQRVALARALAREPDVLLLDEPLGALDAKLRNDMQAELKDLHEHTGKTFVLVTHDQAEAMALSDTIVILNSGRIEQVGTPFELYNHPLTRFVATFVGNHNILDCRVTGTDGEAVALDWFGQTVIAEARGRRPVEGDAVQVAVRPEMVRCGAWNPAHPAGCSGEVRRRVFKGGSTVLTIATQHGTTLAAAMAPLEVDGLPEKVSIEFLPGAAQILAEPPRP